MITVDDLRKEYTTNTRDDGFLAALKSVFNRETKTVRAVKDISFTVETGEMVGFLGPNGAGKSTTVKMLTGGIKPTNGRIEVNGHHPWDDRKDYVQDIGVVFGQKTQLFQDIPAVDAFRLIQDIYQIPEDDFQRRLTELTDLFNVNEVTQSPVRKLSLGQRMKCEFIASLLHGPSVLYLDEPTIGLDANAKQSVRTVLKRLNDETNITLFLTTHDMDDVEALCERVIVLDDGNKIYDGTIQGLRDKYVQVKHVTIDYQDTIPDELIETYGLHAQNNRVQGQISAESDMQTFFNTVFQETVLDLTFHDDDLEHIIQRIYNE
jgi:ABC-2 type transport system ATP-binding protein